jgi:hypothetical protein
MIRDELTEEGAHWLKAISNETKEIAGYCKWRYFAPGKESDTSSPEWPEGADKKLCNETFGAWAKVHPELMDGREHSLSLYQLGSSKKYPSGFDDGYVGRNPFAPQDSSLYLRG